MGKPYLPCSRSVQGQVELRGKLGQLPKRQILVGARCYRGKRLLPARQQHKPKHPKRKSIMERWSSKLSDFSNEEGKQILFTELGYRSMEKGLARPWDAAHHGEFDEKLQAIAYTGFFEGIGTNLVGRSHHLEVAFRSSQSRWSG